MLVSFRPRPFVFRFLPAAALAAAGFASLGLLGCATAAAPRHAEQERVVPRRLELLGQAVLPSLELNGTILGGLSGLTWVSGDDYLAISDDKSEFGPPRFYRLSIRPEGEPDGKGRRIRAEVRGWTSIREQGGGPLEAKRADLEGFAALGEGDVFVSSEGWGERLIPPFVTHLAADGTWREDLPLPEAFVPTADGRRGVRSNLAFESLTTTPDRRYLFTATENALAQDGPPSEAGISSPSRLLRYDLEARRWDRQWLYPVEPPRFRPQPGAVRAAGLVDLEAIDAGHLLALERSFERGHGYDIRIFAVETAGAEDISSRLAMTDGPSPRPVRKRLLLDLTRLGIRLDNLEGLALGRRLPDGRRRLVLVSDDNYKHGQQVNQVLVFALTLSPR